jgi:glycosyltransferase involved in cell wall biosynthesis
MTEGLHICLLTSSRLSKFTYGGEGKFTISLGKWLVRRNQVVTLMGSGFGKLMTRGQSEDSANKIRKETIPQKNYKVISIPYSVYLIYRVMILTLWIIKIMYINQKSPITLIHAQDTGYAGLAAVLTNKLLGIPSVISSHGIRHKTQESSIHGKLKKILFKIEYSVDIFSIKNAKKVIADNDSIKEYFEQMIPTVIDVIPIPIKLNNFEFSEENRDVIRKELGIDKTTRVIGFVGRLSPEKNLLNLLISFDNATHDVPSIKLVLVGAGPLESRLREYVTKRTIEDKVIFCGIRQDVDKILSSFDIFVLPSYTEGSSVALLEAMSCSRAIICSDIPTNRELVRHNQQALLVNPYSQEELKQAIVLLSNDQAFRLKLGYKARIRVSQYDEDQVFPRFLQYYQNLVKERTDEK